MTCKHVTKGWVAWNCMCACVLQPAALSASNCFFKSKKSVFVCEIPLERGGFSSLGTGMSWESSQWKEWRKNKVHEDHALAEPLEKGQPAKQGSRGGCTCNSRHPTHPNNNNNNKKKMGGVMMIWLPLGKRWMGGQLLGKRWMGGQLLGKRWMGGQLLGKRWMGPLQQRMGLAGMGVGRRIHTHQAKKHKSHHHP